MVQYRKDPERSTDASHGKWCGGENKRSPWSLTSDRTFFIHINKFYLTIQFLMSSFDCTLSWSFFWTLNCVTGRRCFLFSFCPYTVSTWGWLRRSRGSTAVKRVEKLAPYHLVANLPVMRTTLSFSEDIFDSGIGNQFTTAPRKWCTFGM